MIPAIRKVVIATAILLAVIGLGGIGYSLLGGESWTIGEALYFAIITVSTVGYGEMHDLGRIPGARLLTGILILIGSAALVYFQSNITAALIEGRLGQAFRRKRMKNQIKALHDHIVVAGVGLTGQHVVEELVATQRPFVVIDRDADRLEWINEEICEGKLVFVRGDATEDHSLIEAGIERAQGVISALTSDHQNLYVTLSARSLNPKARIIAKVVEAEAVKKMMIAGADATVSPTIIGGQRMASELIRPEVIAFLDQMIRDKDKNLRLEDVNVDAGSSFVGKTLRDLPFRSEINVLVLAVRDKDGTFIYNPGPDFCLEAGSALIVIGEVESVRKLRRIHKQSMRPPPPAPPPSRPSEA